MKIYIGYVLGDYAEAYCMSANRSKVEEEMQNVRKRTRLLTWIKEKEINKNTFFKFTEEGYD